LKSGKCWNAGIAGFEVSAKDNIRRRVKMSEEKKVRDIMVSLENYDRVDMDSRLSDALGIMKRNYEALNTGEGGFHKTLMVTDSSGGIVGKLSMYDLIRGLVPASARAPEISKAYHAMLSSRALEVTEEVADQQEHFQWLSTGFSELIRQELRKTVKDVMKPVVPSVLREDDSINQAIYVIFKEDVRQQFIYRNGKPVGVVNLITIFSELLKIA